jgi:hypothetical protein
MLASAHACQTHTHLLHIAATDAGVAATESATSASAVQARLAATLAATPMVALFLPSSLPPRLAAHAERWSTQSSRLRPFPLAFARALRL